ncbi:MAG TPA: hypothetical protein VHQ90_16375 [Thermoanaerobaculia bacterium]|nr:hypothetical protein [Thermoanaerobaculia bacterium]
MAESKRWVVTTSGDRPIRDIAKKLTKTGFAVDQVFDEIGSITGSADTVVVEKLREIPGVADVSPELSFNIGPPDAPVT